MYNVYGLTSFSFSIVSNFLDGEMKKSPIVDCLTAGLPSSFFVLLVFFFRETGVFAFGVRTGPVVSFFSLKRRI